MVFAIMTFAKYVSLIRTTTPTDLPDVLQNDFILCLRTPVQGKVEKSWSFQSTPEDM